MQTITFDQNNDVEMSAEEVLQIIAKESIITIIMGEGFDENSDTADVFRGMIGVEAFEQNEDIDAAMHCGDSFKYAFILSNAKEETPFNEIGMAKRLIRDGFWTNIILHDHPLKDGMYAMIRKK